MKQTPQLLAFTAALFLASCENPADKTANATVSDAVQSTTASSADGIAYTLTADSEIHFIGSKVTGSHSGGFKKLTGNFTVANHALAGSGHKVSIDMNSVWTDNEKLTEHLKSEDFFNVAKFPESSFELTGIKTVSDGNYLVSGNLNLHGTTKKIAFPATASITDGKVKIHAKFDINRKDFGITYAGKADDLIRDEVVIELKLNAEPVS